MQQFNGQRNNVYLSIPSLSTAPNLKGKNYVKYRIAIVDDEMANLESLERIFKSDGAEVLSFLDPRLLLASLPKNPVDLVLTDLRMGTLSGIDLLQAIKHLDASLEVILVTAYGTVEIAVEAMKKGAYDFIPKPLQRMQVLKTVHLALERRRLVDENSSLKEEMLARDRENDNVMVGRSRSYRDMLAVADQAANSQANVLIEGESGTGKGILADYIHRNNARPNSLLVKINCTAIPEHLLEAELFGYEVGAFTGANKRKKGRIEFAHEGTLFLDEVGIAPLTFQTKLLRFLQEGEFERLGGNSTISVNTRVIAATNTDLKQAIEKGTFREDLYYRLKVIHFTVPSLRDRKEDIPILIKKFIAKSAKKNSRPVPFIHPATMECLVAYHWPGNIRELENLIERCVVLNRNGMIEVEDLPSEFAGKKPLSSFTIPIGIPLREIETLVIDEMLRSTRGDKRLAAQILGIHPRTISRYLETQEAKMAVIAPPRSPELPLVISPEIDLNKETGEVEV